MNAQTISEKILGAHCGRVVRAGEIIVADVDVVVGTDGSGPLAIDYFERMGGTRLHDPSRVFFSLDHYAPPTTPETRAFHDRIRTFASQFGASVMAVGEGISHQVLVERGTVQPGQLVVGADSHTVMCGALNCFAIGVGSSDLAAAMLTGKVWLRVPESIRVRLAGVRPDGVAAKDVALALISELGADGADYQAVEFTGDLSTFTLDDRMVLSSLLVEAGAKAAIFPHDDVTATYLETRGRRRDSARASIRADADANYARELEMDLASLSPRIARPHAPNHVGALEDVRGPAVHMVFIGTCTGGRAQDFHEALDAFERAGGHLARGVQLVLTPASQEVHARLVSDGTMQRFLDADAVVTTPGCGACCGTSGVIPGDDMTVLSTANRNFKARMGNATARIYLASPAVCGVAAATGHVPSLAEWAAIRRAR